MKQKFREWETGHAELEQVIASMTKDLKKTAEQQTTEGRAAKAMLFIMPGFTRAMDHERAILAKTAQRTPSGKSFNGVEDLNDHLFVMTNAMANMVIGLIANAITCELDPICRDCLETRLSLLRNVIGNVATLAASGVDRAEVPERFHS